MHLKKIIQSSILFLTSAQVIAQQKTTVADTTIKATTIEITQIYQPQIKQAVKASYTPTLPPSETKTIIYEYNIPVQAQNYSYKPLPLKPLALGVDTSAKTYKNYIKTGLGNLRTLYLDAGLGGVNIKNLESNIHLGFLSQKGELNYQKQDVAALNALGIYSFNRRKLSFGLDASHLNFYQYGYDQVALPNKIAGKQTLNGGKLSAELSDNNVDQNGFKKSLGVTTSYYSGNNISSEISVGAHLGANKIIDSNWNAHIGIEALSTNLNSEFYKVSNNFASVKIGAEYHSSRITLRAFLLPTIAQNNNTFLLNDIEFRYKKPEMHMQVALGIKGSLTQNTYQQLFSTNPYISQFPSVQSHSNELFLSMQKAVGHHLSFDARISWWQFEQLTTFLNSNSNNSEKMMVYYIPKANALSLQLAARYQMGNILSVGGQLSIFKYSNIANNSHVWHLPTSKIIGDFCWNILPELSVSAYASFIGGNYARDISGNSILLKPYADIGLGGEYLALKKLSLFLTCNNLLNIKYQRWQAYQAYGINIYGGVRLKF